MSFPPAHQRSLLLIFLCYHLVIVVDTLKAMGGDKQELEDPVPLAIHTGMLGCLLILLGIGHKSQQGGTSRPKKQKR